MLGSAAIFGSKGMVRVPTITGLSTSAAATTAQASGLTASSTGTVTTYETGLNGIVASQSPSANSLAEYDSNISYQYYVYETPPCTGTQTIWWAYCSGNVLESGSITWYHCTETYEQALDREIPNWGSIGGFQSTNGGPITLDCGGGSTGGDSGGGGGCVPNGTVSYVYPGTCSYECAGPGNGLCCSDIVDSCGTVIGCDC